MGHGIRFPNPPFSLDSVLLPPLRSSYKMDFTSHLTSASDHRMEAVSVWDLSVERVGPNAHTQHFLTLVFQVHNLFFEPLGVLGSNHYPDTHLLWVILGYFFLSWPWFLHLNFKESYLMLYLKAASKTQVKGFNIMVMIFQPQGKGFPMFVSAEMLTACVYWDISLLRTWEALPIRSELRFTSYPPARECCKAIQNKDLLVLHFKWISSLSPT